MQYTPIFDRLMVALFLASYASVMLAIAMSMRRAPDFWRGAFTDGGQSSFSRIATAALVMAVIAWNTFIVIKTSAMPDVGGEALLIGILYGANVAGSTVAKVANKPPTG